MWSKLRGKILITGGTGFVGQAMTTEFIHSDADADVYLTTRRYKDITPTDPRIHVIPRELDSPYSEYDHIVHLEPDVGNNIEYWLMSRLRCRGNFLYASSGAAAVLATRYAKIKLNREKLLRQLGRIYRVNVKIARLWTFIGPNLPLGHAVSDFLNDALHRRPIIVKGDGKAVRSYLYTSDLGAWMWKILLAGQPTRVYNVGSPDPITVGNLAIKIGFKYDQPVIFNGDKDVPSTYYVPNDDGTMDELGLQVTVPLDEAIERTMGWMTYARVP